MSFCCFSHSEALPLQPRLSGREMVNPAFSSKRPSHFHAFSSLFSPTFAHITLLIYPSPYYNHQNALQSAPHRPSFNAAFSAFPLQRLSTSRVPLGLIVFFIFIYKYADRDAKFWPKRRLRYFCECNAIPRHFDANIPSFSQPHPHHFSKLFLHHL